ncbi:MAG: ribonuclease [Firmicutes bacterium]|nr:ribonuclease [Bacillota bacterium]
MNSNSSKTNAGGQSKASRILRFILAAAVIVLFLVAYNRLWGGQSGSTTDLSGSTGNVVSEVSFAVDSAQEVSAAPEISSAAEISSIQEISSAAEVSSASAAAQDSPAAEYVASEPEEASVTESTVISEPEPEESSEPEEPAVLEDDEYYTPEDVALYLHLYGHLPSNYITKEDAQDAGWVSSKGNLWKVTDHKVIGGSRFGNYEGSLPTAKGRKYYECDVNYYGGYRGEERLVYSNDGLIYYTDDHYNTFTLLYDKDGAK